jgi:hypothetical protein
MPELEHINYEVLLYNSFQLLILYFLDKNPNAYYYRFNDPGEKQRNGAWTKEEIGLFNARMKEMGVNGQWGIFAMEIPGRVGYQCSNFYRHLIETKKIVDDNYIIDDKGKAHFVFKGGRRKTWKRDENGPSTSTASTSSTLLFKLYILILFIELNIVKKKKGEKKKRKKLSDMDNEEEEEEDFDDDDYRPSTWKRGLKCIQISIFYKYIYFNIL